MRLILWLLLFLCPYMSIGRQTPVMKVGGKVPNVELRNLVNHTTTKARLYDFKSQLLLIDLWATTCSACIGELKMLDSMQHCYPGQLSVVAINSLNDTKEKLDGLIKRLNLKVNIPMVLGNKEIQSMFPHTFVPHFVWLDSNFKVLAITNGEVVTAARIQRLIEGHEPDFTDEDAVPLFNSSQILFINGNAGDGKQLLARSTFSGHIPGIPVSNYPLEDITGRITRWLITNESAQELLAIAYGYSAAKRDFIWEGIALTGKFTYELITPPVSRKEAMRLMQQDLQRYLGVSAEISSGPAPVLFIHHLPN